MDFADGLDDWMLGGSFHAEVTGTHWQDYSAAAADGVATLSATVPHPYGNAGLGQSFAAGDYRGATVTLRAQACAEDVAGRATLWLRTVTLEHGGHGHHQAVTHGTLRWLGERQFAFLHRCGGELQCCQDVSPFQIRVISEDLLGTAPGRELTQDGTHGHSGVPDAGQTAHPVRVDGDPLVRHAFRVRQRGTPQPSRQSAGETLVVSVLVSFSPVQRGSPGAATPSCPGRRP